MATARPTAQYPQAPTARAQAEQHTREATAPPLVWQDPRGASTAWPFAARQARRASTASPAVSQYARGATTARPPAQLLKLHRHSLTHVLIQGGSDNERLQLARAFHRESPNGAGAFVRVDCRESGPRLCEALQEFIAGTEPAGPNPVREAAGGTLFLDSIASLSPRGQRMLLELASPAAGSFAGSWQGRLIVGSRSDLDDAVGSGRFMATLHDCLDKLRIQLEAVA